MDNKQGAREMYTPKEKKKKRMLQSTARRDNVRI